MVDIKTEMARVPSKQLSRSHRAKEEWYPPEKFRTVSLKTLAGQLDAARSSVRRWLKEAGIHPISIGQGRRGALRYRWRDVQEWLESRQYVE